MPGPGGGGFGGGGGGAPGGGGPSGGSYGGGGSGSKKRTSKAALISGFKQPRGKVGPSIRAPIKANYTSTGKSKYKVAGPVDSLNNRRYDSKGKKSSGINGVHGPIPQKDYSYSSLVKDLKVKI